MDGSRFDSLTRLLATGRSRRQVLTAVGASIGGFLAGGARTLMRRAAAELEAVAAHVASAAGI